jgi:aspartate racemase
MLGIIGGMGPAAGFDLAQKITQVTPAQSDQDHLDLLVASTPTIPDRTEALTYEGPDFVPAVVQAGQQLVAAGADQLVMACNTAHAEFDRIQSELPVPLLNMPELVMQQVADLGVDEVVLFASDGTLISGVYEQAAADNQIRLIKPTFAEQFLINEAIYRGVKSGNLQLARSLLLAVIQNHPTTPALLACTELPLALPDQGLDANLLLAQALLLRLTKRKICNNMFSRTLEATCQTALSLLSRSKARTRYTNP